MDDDSIVKYGHSTRVEEDTIRQYKWTDEKLDSDAFLYQNVINFKRSANPRGHAHHCVMCGDKRAAIPSQNKDVCKTCDSAYWLVENIQILVKFCKGCKNFTKLHDFRDKPEATKCIKCRQRGRQNYFAKKGRVDVLPNPHPRTNTTQKHNLMASSVANAHMTDPAHGGRYATPYEMYGDVDEAMAPRLTSNRQKDMQKNRMSRYQDRSMPMGANASKYMKNAAAAANIAQNPYPPDMMMIGYGPRRDRSNSINSLLHGYTDLPLDFQMYDGQDYDLKDDDEEAGDGRSRSNTLLSVGSVYDDKKGGGGGGQQQQQRRPSGARNRTTSEEWGSLAQATASTLVSDMFKDQEGTTHPQFMQPVVAPSGGSSSGMPPMPPQAGGEGGRKRRVSIDLTNYFSGGGGWTGEGDNEGGGGNNESFETKRARTNSISDILSSII